MSRYFGVLQGTLTFQVTMTMAMDLQGLSRQLHAVTGASLMRLVDQIDFPTYYCTVH